MNIAIDGPSGAGKSSLAKGIAKHYGIVYVDTGALYRTVGLYARRKGFPVEEVGKILPFLSELKVSLRYERGEQQVYLFDENVSGQIRTPGISMYASAVSNVFILRNAILSASQLKTSKRYLSGGKVNFSPSASPSICVIAPCSRG